VLDNIQDWYRSADTKAQVILALDGVFVAFLVNTAFRPESQIQPVIQRLGVEVWGMLGLMFVCLVGSIGSALLCLRSRLYPEAQVEKRNQLSMQPEASWFFQTIGWLDGGAFLRSLASLDADRELQVIAHEAVILARNVTSKHRWVNRGFALAGMAFALTALASIDYVVRLAL